MSDLNFEADSSGAEQSLQQFATAVNTLKRALEQLDKTPMKAIQAEIGAVNGLLDKLSTEVKGTAAQVQKEFDKAGKQAGSALSKSMAAAIMAEDAVRSVQKTSKEVRRALAGHYDALGNFVSFEAEKLAKRVDESSKRSLLLDAGLVRTATQVARRELAGYYDALGNFVSDASAKLAAQVRAANERALMLDTSTVRKATKVAQQQVAGHYDALGNFISEAAAKLAASAQVAQRRALSVGADAAGSGLDNAKRQMRGHFDALGNFVQEAAAPLASATQKAFTDALSVGANAAGAGLSAAKKTIAGHYDALGNFVSSEAAELAKKNAEAASRALSVGSNAAGSGLDGARRQMRGHYDALGNFIPEAAAPMVAASQKAFTDALSVGANAAGAGLASAKRAVEGHYDALGNFISAKQAQLAASKARALSAGSNGVAAAASGGRRATVGSYDALMNLVPQPAARAASSVESVAMAVRASMVEAEKTAPSLNRLGRSMNDLHSAARGVASGFGAMWLTWGAIGPLLAGAAISNALAQSVKKGAEFEHTLTAIGALADATGEELGVLKSKALELGSQGPFGPLELAQAFKTLALAGLEAKEQLGAISAVKNFAIVGETDLKASAEGLVAISTAYGYSARNYSVVADVVAKTAASSMASVSDMTEAFKQASVVAQQYGVTLEDTSTTLALLSNIGITGSAAGTAMRNMYTELMGSSKKARKVLEETLKVDVWDEARKAMKPLPVIMDDMLGALSKLDTKSQQKALQDLGNERGTKALAANLTALVGKFDETGRVTEASVKKIREELAEAPGYVAVAAAVMGTTTVNQFKAVGAALETSLVASFEKTEPAVQAVAAQLKSIFGSDEFKNGVSGLAGSVADLTRFLLDNADVIGTLVKGYIAYKAVAISAQLATVAWASSVALATAAGRAWATFTTIVEGSIAVLRGAASGTLVFNSAVLALTGTLPAAGGALAAFTAASAALLGSLLAVGAAFAAFNWLISNSHPELEEARSKTDALKLSHDGMIASIKEEIKRLDEKAAARAAGVEEANVEATVERNLAKQRIEDFYRAEQKLLDIEAQAKKSDAAVRDFWLGWIPGVGDDNQSGLQASLKEIEDKRAALNAKKAAELKLIQDLMEKAKEDARKARELAAANNLRRPSGPGTYDSDDESGGKGAFGLPSDNLLQEMEKRYSKALQVVRDYTQTQKTVLDDARQAEAISLGTASARELLLVEDAEKRELETIRKASADMAEAYEERRQKLEAALAKVGRGASGSAQAARLEQDIQNLDQAKESFDASLAGDKSKLENSIYVRVQKLASQAAGAIRKLNEEQRLFERAEERQAEDRRSDFAMNQAAAGMTTVGAEILRAEYTEKKRLLDLDRARTDAIDEQTRAIADFKAEVETAYILTGVMPDGAKAQLDAMNERLTLMVELRQKLRDSAPGKVSEAGGLSAADQLSQMGQLDLAAAFDAAQVSVGGLTLSLAGAVGAMEKLVGSQEAFNKAKASGKLDAKALAKAEADNLRAQVKGTSDLLGATKGFFKEKTGAYKALNAAEKAYRVAEMALAAQSFMQKMGFLAAEQTAELTSAEISMLLDETVTASDIANSQARTQVKGIEALVAQLTLPFPANVPAYAMVAAMLASLGVAIGGAGGGSGPKVDQGNTGTGTVFGDAGAQSESISKSLEFLQTLVSLTGVQVSYTARMVNSLESVLQQSGSVAGLVTRNGSLDLAAGGVATGFKTSGLGSLLGTGARGTGAWLTTGLSEAFGLGSALGNIVGKLFGTSIKVTGQGVFAGPQTYGDIANGGMDVMSYADVFKKKKKFGITTSKSNKTIFQDAGAETRQQFGAMIESLGEAVISSVGAITGDTESAAKKLETYTVNLGKINTQGKSGKEIAELLTAVFSAEGDKMAAALLPGITELQGLGEGALETLVRYAGTLTSVNDNLEALGNKLFDVSLAGAKMAVDLANAFGGADKYSSAISTYYENFYSEGERTAKTTERLKKALGDLGFSMPATRDAYRKMVDDFVSGGGLLTESGRAIYAELITLSEPFSSITESVDEMKDALISASKDIMDYVKELTADRAGLATPLQKLQASRETYITDLGLAKSGDKDALGRLTESANAYIEAQKGVTASSSYTQAVIDQVIAELTGVAKGIPAYAAGGYHAGGWALVGEQGPELAYFGSDARIYTAGNTSAMLSTDELVSEVRALRTEVVQLRAQQSMETQQIVTTNIAAQQQAAGAIVDGIAGAAERQAWVEQSKPEIK